MSDYPHTPPQWERLKDNGELNRYYTKYRSYQQTKAQDTPTSHYIKQNERRLQRKREAKNHGVNTENYR